MSLLTPEIAEEVLAACQNGAAEANEALARSLDCEGMQIEPMETVALSEGSLPEGIDGPGLAVLLKVDSAAAVLIVPESSGLLPDWYADPDVSGQSKLDTLAQELGMLLLPESCMPTDFKSSRVEDLSAALRLGELAESAAEVLLKLTAGEKSAIAHLVWPIENPDALLSSPESKSQEGEGEQKASEDAVSSAPTTAAASVTVGEAGFTAKVIPQDFASGIHRLPQYGRSLLKIKVPVIATLARKKQSIAEIIKLAPGDIIQFEKSCEDALDLEVGNQSVALGEAVKIGDKFGLRIISIVMPSERFKPLGGQGAS